MLAVLSARKIRPPLFASVSTNGKIIFNGQEATEEAIKELCSFVRQDDSHLMPALTARETLSYAALLRLPASFSKEEKMLRAEEVLASLGLLDCANTIVGGNGVKGLSGGEKRRLSIGVQLLNDPSVLIVDGNTLVMFRANQRS